MELKTLWLIWGILALVVLVLFIVRQVIASREDDTVHLESSEAEQIAAQEALAKKIARIDSWGKTLTAVAGLYLLALLGMHAYRMWEASNQLNMR